MISGVSRTLPSRPSCSKSLLRLRTSASTVSGVYDAVNREIDRLSEKYFPGFRADSIERVYGANPFSDLVA